MTRLDASLLYKVCLPVKGVLAVQPKAEGNGVFVGCMHAGHWKLGHTLKNLILTQMQMLCTFALFSLVKESTGLFTSFGFVNQRPAFIAYTLFSIISAPVNEVGYKSAEAFAISSLMKRIRVGSMCSNIS